LRRWADVHQWLGERVRRRSMDDHRGSVLASVARIERSGQNKAIQRNHNDFNDACASGFATASHITVIGDMVRTGVGTRPLARRRFRRTKPFGEIAMIPTTALEAAFGSRRRAPARSRPGPFGRRS
jgi:hypothetical protein